MPHLSFCAHGFALVIALCFVSGCDKTEVPSETTLQQPTENTQALASIGKAETNAMFQAGTKGLEAFYAETTKLNAALQALLAAPNEKTLKAAQQIWFRAAAEYRHFHFFRHIAIVQPSEFSRLNRLDYQVAGHPIQPGFLDAFGEYKYSGLVFDAGFPITEESLVHQHGLTDLSEVVLGLYAIEFMLFNVEQPRDVNDYKAIATLDAAKKELGYEKANEIPNNRRRELLRQQAAILVKNSKELLTIWGNNKSAAYKQWQSLNTKKQIDTIRLALQSALTQVMLEIGALNQTKEEAVERLSPQVFASDFYYKQQFIYAAAASAESALPLLINSAQPSIKEALDKAIALTQKEALKEGASEADHWREVFSAIKSANDALMPSAPIKAAEQAQPEASEQNESEQAP